MNIGKCLKCKSLSTKRLRRLQKHHVYPKRHFGNGKKNNIILHLCNEHHQELDSLIFEAEIATNGDGVLQMQDPYFYEKIHIEYFGKEVFWEEIRKQLIKKKRGKHYNGKIILANNGCC